MHRLLERQLKKATGANGQVDVARLAAMVDAAYEEADCERRLKSHALQEMQREVEDLNRRVREEADARFNVLMGNVAEAVVIVDDRGRIESFNKAAERIFEFSAQEVQGQSVAALTAAAGPWLPECLQDQDAFSPLGLPHEATAWRKSGEEFPIDLAVGEVISGPNRRYVAVIRDISQRKRTERELRESESRFRDLAGSASDWFWETGKDHRLTFVSERIAAVMGVKPPALLGSTFFDIGLSDDPELSRRHLRTLNAHEPFRDCVFHVGPEHGDDSRTIRISGLPVFNEDGAFTGYRGVGVDITREMDAENRARHAQQRLAEAIERIIDGIAIFDSQDRLVVFNPEYQRIFSDLGSTVAIGNTFEMLVGVNPSAFNTEGEAFDLWRKRRLDHHRNASGEPFHVRLSDGRWILHREFRMADGGTVGLRTDITDMKQREQEIDALKRRYKMILDAAGEGIVGLEAMIGSSFHELVQPQSVSQDVGNGNGNGNGNGSDSQNDNGGSHVSAAYRDSITTYVSGEDFALSNGKNLPVDYFAAPICEGEAVAGAVVVFRDATLRLQYERTMADNQRELERLVTERTQALSKEVDVRARTEASLRESRERLKSITDNLFEGVLVVNRYGDIAFANPSARRLLGCMAEPEGHPLDSLFSLGRRQDEGYFASSPWRKVAHDGGTLVDDDSVFLTADGRQLPVAYACSAMNVDGTARAAIISFRDIGALKEAQREALQASRLASVGQLAAGIAHEINTPIQYVGDNLRFLGDSFSGMANVIAAASALADLSDQASPPVPTQAFRDAMRNADVEYLLEETPNAISQSLDGVGQVSRIVLSMKEFSHPGSSSKSMTDINRALESTLTVTRNSWKHVANLEKRFDLSLPLAPCHAGELNQVFLNLIMNATHAIETAAKPGLGTIVVTTRREGDQVVISVEDSGTGISEAIRDKIFDPFFTTKTVGKGTGQGLAICRDVIVAKHGGRIEVGGQEGVGAIFSIWLPLDPVGETAMARSEDMP